MLFRKTSPITLDDPVSDIGCRYGRSVPLPGRKEREKQRDLRRNNYSWPLTFWIHVRIIGKKKRRRRKEKEKKKKENNGGSGSAFVDRNNNGL